MGNGIFQRFVLKKGKYESLRLKMHNTRMPDNGVWRKSVVCFELHKMISQSRDSHYNI